jgi:putative ABC transport system ATP-binding protein
MPRALEARSLVVARGGRRILDGASLVVGPGEAVAIQGPSGSGKSTLVRVLATLLEADAGEVVFGGRDARTIAPTEYRMRVAFLAQQPAMLPGSVADNLRAGPELHGRTLPDERAKEMLGAVGLTETLLSHDARTLSGGEKQRVALARALANDPEVLLLDEPTAALDPEAGRRIVGLIRDLSGDGRSVVMVTHVEEHARLLGGTRYRCEAGVVSREAA